MTRLNLWLKDADVDSYFNGLTATEAKTLKDYLHGANSPQMKLPAVSLRISTWEPSAINPSKAIWSLWCEVLAPIRGGSQIRPESNIQWINLNAFLARLASINTCNIGLDRVGYLCDSFIKHDDVRDNAVMFNIGVSAAAQYMIYSASKVFEFCEREDILLRHLGWVKWKAGFMEAQTNPLINASGKKHATLAVAAMNKAEMDWNRRQGLRGMDQAKHERSCSEEIQRKQT
ncbi:hypothetical protein MMC31_004794 [Peltigera leucophlebia]|nr:hypothetical protein [Peltigera leucophlebia]